MGACLCKTTSDTGLDSADSDQEEQTFEEACHSAAAAVGSRGQSGSSQGSGTSTENTFRSSPSSSSSSNSHPLQVASSSSAGSRLLQLNNHPLILASQSQLALCLGHSIKTSGRSKKQSKNKEQNKQAEKNGHQATSNHQHQHLQFPASKHQSVNSILSNNRLCSLQSKLSLHADRLVMDTLESIQPTVLSESSNSMQKLHLIAETELGWLVVINSLINKVNLEHPFGSALILLILEDAPLPCKKSIGQLDQVLELESLLLIEEDELMQQEHSTDHWHHYQNQNHYTNNQHNSWSVARQRNMSIVLGCLAEKLAGSMSSTIFTELVQRYLLTRLQPEHNDLNVILYSLIALEKFSQTTDNKRGIVNQLKQMGSRNPLLRLETLASSVSLETHHSSFTINDKPSSLNFKNSTGSNFHSTTLSLINRKSAILKKKNNIFDYNNNNTTSHLDKQQETRESSRRNRASCLSSARTYLQEQVSFCAQWHLDNYFINEDRPYSYELVDRENLNAMLNVKDVSENLKISPDGLAARNDTSRFESVRCTYAMTSGTYYYEVQLITAGVMQIGLATKQSRFLNYEGFGIGDDDHSLAYDGCRQLIWQNAKSSHTRLSRWKEGDIVGCLIDLNKFQVTFSLNGKMGEPNGDLFRNKCQLSSQYYAAASFMPFQHCVFNFGRTPFKYPPVEVEFRSFNQCASLGEDQKIIMPKHLLLKRGPTINGRNSVDNFDSMPTTMCCTICCDNLANIILQPCEHR